jgi:hypothetical protein
VGQLTGVEVNDLHVLKTIMVTTGFLVFFLSVTKREHAKVIKERRLVHF